MALLKLKDLNNFLNNFKEQDKEQTFSEAVLEASGINIPLPTQEEVVVFYKEVKEPSNPLTKIDPEEWTTSQFLDYQSDVKKFQTKNRFKGIKNATKLKQEKNKEKEEKKRKKFK